MVMTTPRIEELRHLHERSNYEYLFTAHGPGAWAKRKDYIKTMRNVLPDLLRVAEAARRVEGSHEDDDPERWASSWEDLADALTALYGEESA